ncbi:VOC family protein [Kineococcus sp. GCM10028916]|uniref:VOC family protein n=1 Tax=Kineococcus sp. GCM10028916 TaxID=3273394 RepID=UPI003637380E
MVILSSVLLTVHDHDEALTFYRDLLGFAVTQDVSYEGMRWVTVTPADQPDVHVVLETPQSWPDASPADREAIAELLVKGLVSRLIFTTDDVDALHDKLSAAGAEILQEPVDQQYGVRDFGVRDPSGNQLRFNQPLADAPSWS